MIAELTNEELKRIFYKVIMPALEGEGHTGLEAMMIAFGATEAAKANAQMCFAPPRRETK